MVVLLGAPNNAAIAPNTIAAAPNKRANAPNSITAAPDSSCFGRVELRRSTDSDFQDQPPTQTHLTSLKAPSWWDRSCSRRRFASRQQR